MIGLHYLLCRQDLIGQLVLFVLVPKHHHVIDLVCRNFFFWCGLIENNQGFSTQSTGEIKQLVEDINSFFFCICFKLLGVNIRIALTISAHFICEIKDSSIESIQRVAIEFGIEIGLEFDQFAMHLRFSNSFF